MGFGRRLRKVVRVLLPPSLATKMHVGFYACKAVRVWFFYRFRSEGASGVGFFEFRAFGFREFRISVS